MTRRVCKLVAGVFVAGLVGVPGWIVFAQEESAEVAAMRSLDEYLAAFNARDDVAWAKTLHYPHVRIAGDQVRVWEDADEYVEYMDFDRFIEQTGWHHSQWDKRDIIQTGKNKVHVAVQFSRFNADGEQFATYESFYVLTNRDGHWGTQARSSFAP